MHIEDNTLNLLCIRQIRNDRPLKNCGDDSSVVILDGEHLCDTIIARNKDIISDKMIERTYLVLSSLYIIGKKYRIYSRKT